MDRKRAEHVIRKVLFGAPGEEYDTETGRVLVLKVLDRMGLAALTDEAVTLLAAEHEQQDGLEDSQRQAEHDRKHPRARQ